MTIRSREASSEMIHYHDEYNTDHHAKQGFKNPWHLPQPRPGPIDALGWMLSFPFKPREDAPTAVTRLTRQQIESERSRRSCYWIGHATVLLKISGKYVLTDPVFSDRVSPVSFAGPKREVPLPLSIEDLPGVDVVVLSHNHYDHFDSDAIRRIAAKFNPLFVCPLENEKLLRAHGAARIIEMDWWQHVEAEGLRFHCLPARHFSNRGLTDRNEMLWASFLIEDDGWKVYFAGDTGFADHFEKIGRKFPGIDLALIPIGAYMPRWFMHEVHIDPDEAVQAFMDLKAREFLGIHWGTFVLAEESLHAPRDRMEAIIRERSLDAARIHLLAIGGAIRL